MRVAVASRPAERATSKTGVLNKGELETHHSPTYNKSFLKTLCHLADPLIQNAYISYFFANWTPVGIEPTTLTLQAPSSNN